MGGLGSLGPLVYASVMKFNIDHRTNAESSETTKHSNPKGSYQKRPNETMQLIMWIEFSPARDVWSKTGTFGRPEDNVQHSGTECPKPGLSRKNRNGWSACSCTKCNNLMIFNDLMIIFNDQPYHISFLLVTVWNAP